MSEHTAERIRWADVEEDGPMALLTRRRISGERIMLSYIRMESGCVVQAHRHANEQLAVVLEGRIRFGVGEEGGPHHRVHELGAGEVLIVPPDVWHSAEALEDTLILDVFSPPSEKTGVDLLDAQGRSA